MGGEQRETDTQVRDLRNEREREREREREGGGEGGGEFQCAMTKKYLADHRCKNNVLVTPNFLPHI